MAGRNNGTAQAGLLRLGDLTPERRPVEIERKGETITLQGYVNGRRCPGIVKAEVDAAWREHQQETTKAGPDGTEVRAYEEAAWRTFLRKSIAAVVPSLEFDEADVLAGDDEAGLGLLRYLDWWRTGGEAADDSPPAETAESKIGARSSPTSSPDTAGSTPPPS